MRLETAASRASRGLKLLAEGEYSTGWPLFEARFEIGRAGLTKPALPYPEWAGEAVAGKQFVIWPEQGFGDQIQFARFALVLRDLGASVTLICYPALHRLLSQLEGVEVLAAAGAVTFPDPDYWAMAGSLPRWLTPSPEDIPAAPYLRALTQFTPARPVKRIGLVTRGSPAHANDANRSLGAAAARRLADVLGATMSLDPAVTGAADFADTAAIIAGLDLVVTVDTSVAHLAGAMGKPCWVLLPAIGTDWRWMRTRSDSPWYPSIRLFRQPSPGRWDPVIEDVQKALATLPASGF